MGRVDETNDAQELSRFPRLQGKLIEVVSDLLRERLGPCSSYVESLIAIQRAYINTNHPNFLGAAAAMTSVISNKQEKDKKAAVAEERRKRDRRRLREVGAVNGVDVAEAEGEGDEARNHAVPIRPPPPPPPPRPQQQQHQIKGSRSLSPGLGGMEVTGSNIATALNGVRAGSPTRSIGTSAGMTRDSFLNYFFGKEGGIPGGINMGPGPSPPSASIMAGGHRHVSQQIEPSFSQSIRRGETRAVERTSFPSTNDLESNHDGGGYEQDHHHHSFIVSIHLVLFPSSPFSPSSPPSLAWIGDDRLYLYTPAPIE